MSAPLDTTEKIAAYAHPDRLVSTDWLAEHLHDENVVVVESDDVGVLVVDEVVRLFPVH